MENKSSIINYLTISENNKLDLNQIQIINNHICKPVDGLPNDICLQGSATNNLSANCFDNLQNNDLVHVNVVFPLQSECSKNNLIAIDEHESIKNECVESGFEFELLKKIAVFEKTVLSTDLFKDVLNAVTESKKSLSVISRAIENGLDLKNLIPVFGAIDKLNKLADYNENACFSLISTYDFDKTMSNLQYGSRARNITSTQDAIHKNNCATIDEEILNKFVNTFNLINAKDIFNYLKIIYSFANQDRIDNAINEAIDVNSKLHYTKQGNIKDCCKVMEEDFDEKKKENPALKKRNIKNAPNRLDTGINKNRSIYQE